MKNTLIGLIFYIAIGSAYADSTSPIDSRVLNVFKSNIVEAMDFNGKSTRHVAFNKLNQVDQNAINLILKRMSYSFAYCDGSLYVDEDRGYQPAEIKSFIPKITFYKFPLTKADSLNGVNWHGQLVIGMSSGVYRYVGGERWRDMGNTFGGEIAQFTIANGDELGFESSVGFRNEQLLCQDLTEKKALPIVEKIKKEKEAQIRADEEKAQEKADAAEKIITLKPLYPLKVIYPTRAWEAKIQGETTVNVCIKVDGQVDSASISQSSGNADLDKAALIAFQQAIYAPHIEKGIATTGCADIGWGFELDENDFKTQRPLAVANPDYFMRKDFDRVMRKNSDLLQSVYQQENDGNSTSGKAIIVHLEIAPSGRVNRANIVASDLNNPKLDSHMLNTIMLFSFSASSNFVSFYGNYKYVFNN